MKPLSGGVDDGLATIGGLHAELQRFQEGACTLGDEFHGDLAGDTTEGLAYGNRTKSPVGLAQGHNGRATHERADGLGHLALQEEVDNLSDEAQKEIRRGRPHGIETP